MIDTTKIKITQKILSQIAQIDEFKGAWRAIGKLAPEQLLQLQKVATIESIGSSTRIEGSKLTDKEVELLLKNLALKKFTTRDEQEVGGYAEAMNLVFQHHAEIPITENYIKQLHSQLLQFSNKDAWHKGNYKTSPNHVVAVDENGKQIAVLFETASPFETPLKMQDLLAWTKQEMNEKTLHPLLIIAVFVVSFLAIHPFQDGNGRLSRILTTCLLLQHKYAYVPYSSLESVIEQNKQAYYLALRQTQATLQNKQPNWEPWLLFFFQALLSQKEKLEAKIEIENLLLVKLPTLSLQILELTGERQRVTIGEILLFTKANRNTIKKHMKNLVSTNRLQKHGTKKGTWYTLQ
jgi:Fic family protein